MLTDHDEILRRIADERGMVIGKTGVLAIREALSELKALRALCRNAGARMRERARKDNVAPDPEMGWWHPDGDLIEALEEAGR